MRAVLFDLDGVLIDSVPAYRRAWALWAHLFSVSEESIWVDAHGRRPEDIIYRVRPDVDLHEGVVAFDRSLAKAVNGHVQAAPGARALLSELSVGTYAIVTSSRRTHVSALLAEARLRAPDVVICGEDVERGKPDPAGFVLAAQELGVPAASCIVVEDAPAGIAGARAAGAAVVALSTTHRSRALTEADAVFDSLAKASRYVLEWVRSPSRG